MKEDMDVLHRLSAQTLRALAVSLREGPMSLSISALAVRQLVGPESSAVFACLRRLANDGMALRHIALLLEAIAAGAESSPDPALLFELVLSGPDLTGVPTQDTAAVFQMLVQEARQEVLLVGYAVYGGDQIFGPLAARMESEPNLKVTFCLDIPRRAGDASADQEIVQQYAREFRQKHWPWPELPELYYDPRALVPGGEGRASLHAKCVVVDQKTALITSANFTEAAQKRNIEVGLLTRYSPIAERIARYFRGLIEQGQLRPCLL